MAKENKKVKISQDHLKCIGCGTCAALCPKFWEMREDDGKAHLKGGKYDKEKGRYEREFEEMKPADLDCNKLAQDACPVQAIKVNP